ncbi:MAG TPA: hypothetical protein VMQ50_09240 [Casimicrobiaceae bacterium]|nr:hypothetical protein [Casimicrobiaceae bacterium]
MTLFPLPGVGYPRAITSGPDGNLWFTDSAPQIGRFTPTGELTLFALRGSLIEPNSITTGPDGNLWFTDVGFIGRITPQGVFTVFPLTQSNVNSVVAPVTSSITLAPDGNLWFLDWATDQVGHITPSGAITEITYAGPRRGVVGMTLGPDGNLWFVEQFGNKVGRMTLDGTVVEFNIPTPDSGPLDIVKGPDGNLWFSEVSASQIGRISPSGLIAEFPIEGVGREPFYIAAGPDGNVWFSQQFAASIGRISPSGHVDEFGVPGDGYLVSEPQGLTTGPDGNLWVTSANATEMVRVNLAGGAPNATASVVEYYDANLDHYFMTQSASEIQALDAGMFPGWVRTSSAFPAYVAGRSSGRGNPVCRFYGLPSAGLDSHFYSASPAECAAVSAKFGWAWEKEADDAFEIALPDTTTGVCPAGTTPVYRLWNGRIDSNHRYTTSTNVRGYMISQGFVPEGYGPLSVAMCAPPAQ